MSFWQLWVKRPQSLWLRKALFQIHLWSGIGIGLYVLMSSITGSAIVFRNEIYTTFTKGPVLVEPAGDRMQAAQIEAAARSAYPKHGITFQSQPKNPRQAVEIWLERGGSKQQRLFDPYTGKDLGPAISPMILWTSWLGDLHINLLGGNTGRIVNGVGAILLTILCLTGVVIWWPGVSSWRRNLAINPRASWKRINWDLHSAVGFWTFGLVFMWAFTGIYVVFPEPFQRGVNSFAPLDYYKLVDQVPVPEVYRLAAQVTPAPDAPPRPRRPRPPRRRSPGDKILGALYAAHFGNFGGWPVKALWVLLGLVPSLLFVTGVIMWWNRVLTRGGRAAAKVAVGEAVLSTGD